MKELKLKFQSTKDVRAINLKGMQEICNHLNEQLDFIVIGPSKKKFSHRYIDAKLNGHTDSDNLRFVKFSFDNKKCKLNITLCLVAGGISGSQTLDMNLFDEKILTKIRTTTREWIYDNVLA